MNKECLKALVAECLTVCGEEETVLLLDRLKRLGYQKEGLLFSHFPPLSMDFLPLGIWSQKGLT